MHFTGKFAAKEAVFKAINDVCDVLVTQIEILNNDKGSPYVNFVAEGKGSLLQIQISISHTQEYAAAVALRVA